MNGETPYLHEFVATADEWETDPFGVVAASVRSLCDTALSMEGAMNDIERSILVVIHKLVS